MEPSSPRPTHDLPTARSHPAADASAVVAVGIAKLSLEVSFLGPDHSEVGDEDRQWQSQQRRWKFEEKCPRDVKNRATVNGFSALGHFARARGETRHESRRSRHLRSRKSLNSTHSRSNARMLVERKRRRTDALHQPIMPIRSIRRTSSSERKPWWATAWSGQRNEPRPTASARSSGSAQ